MNLSTFNLWGGSPFWKMKHDLAGLTQPLQFSKLAPYFLLGVIPAFSWVAEVGTALVVAVSKMQKVHRDTVVCESDH